MKFALSILLAALCISVAAQEKKVEPHPVIVTFYVTNVTCSSCVETIKDAVLKLPSVTNIDLTEDEPFARVSFDSHVVSYHQIAQAIVSSEDGAEKYAPFLKLKIPDYAKSENAAKIDEIFAKAKTEVRVAVLNKEKGEFTVHFLPLKVDAKKKSPQGWNMGKFWHPVHDDPPKGLGLAISAMSEKKK